MPVISRFFGIVIVMYYRDHQPPHFHAKYGDAEVTVDIETGRVVGEISRRVLNLVEEWRQCHESSLIENWERARESRPLVPISPLE